MNKEFFLSLLSQTNNESNSIESNSDTKVLLPKIPFYGLAGTICQIEETTDSYYKVLYNADGNINENKIPVPKKKSKNKKYLLNDYYKDLKKYLEANEAKYLEYENTNPNPILTNTQFYILAIVTFLASVSSLPFLFSTTWIGLIFATISTFSLYVVCDIHKNDLNKQKKYITFINNYKEYQRDLVNYNINNKLTKSKTPKTTYTEIENMEKSNEKLSTKLKQLKKEEL